MSSKIVVFSQEVGETLEKQGLKEEAIEFYNQVCVMPLLGSTFSSAAYLARGTLARGFTKASSSFAGSRPVCRRRANI